MDFTEYGSSWIWHPEWVDFKPGAAGGFVHFKKSIYLDQVPVHQIGVNITADTRYRLYINQELVSLGPVKGDEHRWFFDTVDIRPFLIIGENHINVHVLRFFHATTLATSFARMPIPGLYIRTLDKDGPIRIDTDNTWQTALDPSAHLRTDEPYDIFLNIFEKVNRHNSSDLVWVSAEVVNIEEDWGVTLPWKLCPRMIPRHTLEPIKLKAIHNIRSSLSADLWHLILDPPSSSWNGVKLPAGSSHHIELEAEHYVTALLAFRFKSIPTSSGSLHITYSECYEDEPVVVPFMRQKGNRCDISKSLYGPSDHFSFIGSSSIHLGHHKAEPEQMVYQPFHYRAFRYMALDFNVSPDTDLVFTGVDVVRMNYPLDQKATISTGDEYVNQLWSISVRTLENCMHDCYEDCPFYEQMQYPMDTRSSSLFTYLVSGDDRLPRQAILQLHDSFEPSIGLVHSRSTSGNLQRQFIPVFSLYWINIVVDHFNYFADEAFTRQFMGVCDSILETFSSRMDPDLGLIRAFNNATWEFTDWTRFWSPQGIQPALERTGVSTYTNCLYAYTLKALASLQEHLGRQGLAEEYRSRAAGVVLSLKKNCFDGEYFTDGLATNPVPSREYSQHSQVWAVLCGAAKGDLATTILDDSLERGHALSQTPYGVTPRSELDNISNEVVPDSGRLFTTTSISFAFYTIRALAVAGDDIYNRHFDGFWSFWRQQVIENVSTWVEDSVTVRSDCHAWGSVPIHEFISEVVGIRPALPGWAKVAFKPRLALFPNLQATVPIRVQGRPAKIDVEWHRQDSQKDKEAKEAKQAFDITLKLVGDNFEVEDPVTIIVTLPQNKESTIVKLKDQITITA